MLKWNLVRIPLNEAGQRRIDLAAISLPRSQTRPRAASEGPLPSGRTPSRRVVPVSRLHGVGYADA
jgi:hypothetical protein